MSKSHHRLILAFLALSLLIPSGCIIVDGTSKVWREDQKWKYCEGPGTGEVRFLVREKNRYKVDDGSRLAVGIAPGIPGIARKPGWNWASATVIWCIGAPIMNCGFGFPTIASLFVAPFNREVRRMTDLTDLGFIGCYEWTETSQADELIERGAHEDIVEITGYPAPEGIKIAGETHDGIRLLFEYPGNSIEYSGNSIMLAELKQHGKVAVAFQANEHKYRIFLPAEHFEGAYTFKDVNIVDGSVEMNQIWYFDKAQKINVTVTPLLTHKILGEKATAVEKSVDGLLAALPRMDEAALAGLEKEAESLTRRAHEIAEAEKATAACRAEGVALRQQADKLPQRKFYDLVTDEDFRSKFQALAKQLDACVAEPSPERLKKIESLRKEVKGLEAAFEKLLVSRAERIRAMEWSLERLQVAVGQAGDEKSKCMQAFESRERAVQSDGENAFARLSRVIEEKKRGVSACRQQVAACESEIAWARRLAAPATLAKDSLFAPVAKKAEGAEVVFDEIWKSFYGEGARRTMYVAAMDCRDDGTPNVVVGPDERSLGVVVRVGRNASVHDAWKRTVHEKLGAFALSSQLRAHVFQKKPRTEAADLVHRVAGHDYRFGVSEQAAYERWRSRFGAQFQAELFVEVRLLAADGTVLLAQRQPYKPDSSHIDGEWPDDRLRFPFSANVDAKLLDAVTKVDVGVLDGAAIVQRTEKLLLGAKAELAAAEKESAKAQESLVAERQKTAAQLAAVRKERADAERKCQEKIEKAEAELKAAEARSEDEWRRILKSEGVK